MDASPTLKVTEVTSALRCYALELEHLQKGDKMSDKYVKLFYLFQFITGLHFIAAVLTPFYTDWGHTTLAVAQTLQSWFALCLFLLEVPTGIIADRFGRKYSIFAGCITLTVGSTIYGSFPNVVAFAIGEFVLALGVTLISGADKALLYECMREAGKEAEFASAWAKSRSWHLAGILLGAPVGSIIAQHLGLNWPMLLWAIPSLLGGLTVLLIKEPKNHRASEVSQQLGYLRSAIRGLREAADHPILRSWTINATLVSVAGYFVIWLYQPLMKSLAIPIEYFGFAHAGMVLAEIVTQVSYGKLEQLIPYPRLLFNAFAVMTSLGFMAAVIWPGIGTLIIFLVVSGGIGLTRIEFMTAKMNRYIASEHRATVNSGISMYLRIVQTVLNPFVGLMTDKSVFISLAVIGVLPLLSLLAPLKREENTEGFK